jgi:RNA polymerase sigma factor (sigma-70 family)
MLQVFVDTRDVPSALSIGGSGTRTIPASTLKQMRYRVQRLRRIYGLMADDVCDLQQDLHLHVFQALVRYDPRRATLTGYLRGVLDLWYQSQCRSLRSRSQRRRHLHANRHSDGDDSTASHRFRSYMDEVDTRIELAHTIQRLPDDLRRIANCLLEGMTAIEIAETLGIHRGSVHRMIHQLRPHFGAFCSKAG